MAGLGLACVLAPSGFWPAQIFFIAYLVIGFGQAHQSLTGWLRLRREATWRYNPSLDAAPIMHWGCWLTMPTWLLVVTILAGSRWSLPPEQSSFGEYLMITWG